MEPSATNKPVWYAISTIAARQIFGMTSIKQRLFFREARSVAEAEGLGYHYLREQFPMAQGWATHETVALPVPDADGKIDPAYL